MSWNGSQNGSKSASHRPDADATVRPHTPALVRGVLAGAIIVLIVITVWLLLGKTEQKVPHNNNREDRSVILAQTEPHLSTNKVTAALPVTNRTVRMEKGSEVISSSARTNVAGTVIEILKLADGRTIKKVYPPKPIFNNASDELIATLLSAKPGESVPPLPDLTSIDHDFVQSLLEPIRINESDSDKVKELKLAVKEARAYIAAEIKKGRSVQECLMAHREEMERISDSRAMAVKEIQKMKAEGASDDDVRAFRERVNEVFKEKGIPELTESVNQRETRR